MKLDHSRLDQELMQVYNKMPVALGAITRDNLQMVRDNLAATRPPAPEGAMEPESIEVAGPDGNVTVYVYRQKSESPQPALVWIHGGGYILGTALDDRARDIATSLNCAVFSVDYRIAPEHPFPA